MKYYSSSMSFCIEVKLCEIYNKVDRLFADDDKVNNDGVKERKNAAKKRGEKASNDRGN
jgi:hypothetical protein